MVPPPLRDDLLLTAVNLLRKHGSKAAAARAAGVTRSTFENRLQRASERGYLTESEKRIHSSDARKEEPESEFAIEHETPPIGTSTGQAWTMPSDKDGIYRFAAFGDLHAASKYCRYEVREELTRKAEEFGAQCIYDTGNWIDGEASFNRYDLEVVGLDSQVQMLADRYPRSKIPTFAVTGADHEGWYIKSNGIDVGKYCEDAMRRAGHDWHDLGYIQADIVLQHAKSGATSILRIMHPGGGTAYALSYRPQKIIESFEGGQKPAVLLLGHYHKLDPGHVRNVWYVQTGCGQDQTPFMAQKAIEAHVGGALLELEQDAKTGAIIEFTPRLRRYFARSAHTRLGKANNQWSKGHGKPSLAPRRSNTDA